MKRISVVFLVMLMFFCLTACNKVNDEKALNNETPAPTISENTLKSIGSASSLEEISEIVSTDVENTITALKTEWENLSSNIDTYDNYSDNVDNVKNLYTKIKEDSNQICIRLREYASAYAEFILSSDRKNKEKYKDFSEIYDNIYDDAREEIYDEIYDDILKDMYDVFYDGILKDAYDEIPYKEWSRARSDEYDFWSECRSEVYDSWSDAGSDIYDFWSDIRSDLYDGEVEDAREELQKFLEDIKKLKN